MHYRLKLRQSKGILKYCRTVIPVKKNFHWVSEVVIYLLLRGQEKWSQLLSLWRDH